MIGIRYNSLADLNGQALVWCNKVNGRVHATTNEIPFERLKKEQLNPLTREYIIDKINLRRVQKDCLISYAGNQYSVPAEYVGKDVAVVALDHMLAAYYKGKQIALHRISYQRKDGIKNKFGKTLAVCPNLLLELPKFSFHLSRESVIIVPAASAAGTIITEVTAHGPKRYEPPHAENLL